MKKGSLILQDGHRFDGYLFGAATSSAGEVVFSTGMVGYPESLTDPSYGGQILTFTYPLIGNYGVPNDEKDDYGLSKNFESSKIQVKGIVVSEYSENYSHWRAKKSLADWLEKAGVTGITGIDTRALTKILRTKGSMPGKIVATPTPQRSGGASLHNKGASQKIDFYDPNLTNLVAEVSPKKPQTYKVKGPKTIVMIDCGVKNNTIRNFLQRGITVHRVPWNYNFFDPKNAKTAGIKKFDGLFVSNGPGDPAMLTPTINIIKEALNRKIPTWGICLGNQLLGIAAGGKTYKMKFGNRSQNQPCIDLETRRCYMTTQNHGFSVDPKTLPKGWKIWFQNVNDHTVEGIKHEKLPFSAVQFHPEAWPGPQDTDFLFDRFIKQL